MYPRTGVDPPYKLQMKWARQFGSSLAGMASQLLRTPSQEGEATRRADKWECSRDETRLLGPALALVTGPEATRPEMSPETAESAGSPIRNDNRRK